MQIHELQKNTKKETRTRVGRGGKRGKTSGKGHKGQKARSGGGGSPRPYIREDIKRIPKRRGFGKNRTRSVNDSRIPTQVVKLSELSNVSGKIISPKTLLGAGLVKRYKGKLPTVKILSIGNIEKPFKVVGVSCSLSVKEKIEKAGGSVV